MSFYQSLRKVIHAAVAPRLAPSRQAPRKVERMTVEEAGLGGLMRRRRAMQAGAPLGHKQVLPGP